MKHSNLGLLALSLLLSACASGYEKRQDAFKSSIEYPAIVPVTTARPSVSVKPPHRAEAHATSLWSSSPKSLFGDRRASAEGDILTVTIEIDDEAQLNTSSNTTRGNDRNFSLGSFFGLPEALNPVLPGGATLSPGLDVSGSRNTTGGGSFTRGERITLRLAAQVMDITPNGYLEITGSQKILVNSETRQLLISGLVRPQDISRLNIVTYDKIANARIYYGGEGNLSHAVEPSKGQRLVDKINPF